MKTFRELLIELSACSDAMEFAGDKTVEEALRDCKRGDWILWLAVELHIDIFEAYREYGRIYFIDSSKEVRDTFGDKITTKVNKLLNNE